MGESCGMVARWNSDFLYASDVGYHIQHVSDFLGRQRTATVSGWNGARCGAINFADENGGTCMRKSKLSWFVVALATVGSFAAVPKLNAQQPVDTPNPPTPATSSTPAQEPAPNVPSTTSVPQSHMIRVMQRLNYVCADDNKVLVRLRGTSARVIFKNRIFNMKQVEAASGTKYSDGSVVWWSKGEEGFLEDESKPENSEMLAKDCQLQKNNAGSANKPGAGTISTVSGTVTYLQRVAMPPTAE